MLFNVHIILINHKAINKYVFGFCFQNIDKGALLEKYKSSAKSRREQILEAWNANGKQSEVFCLSNLRHHTYKVVKDHGQDFWSSHEGNYFLKSFLHTFAN